jgi:uncharacterized RDD family membrane protein YckC
MTGRHASVSGFYAGFFTRTAAFLIDWFIVFGVYGLMVSGTVFVLTTFFGINVDPAANSIWTVAGFVAWAFTYAAVSLTIRGHTIGKALVGLTVVTQEGLPIGPRRASVRTLAFPLSFLVLGLGLLGIVLGKERRALHDVIAGTAVVYDWGDRPAELPAPMTRWLESRGLTVTPDALASEEPEATEG